MEKRNWMILYLALAAFIMEWVSGIFDWDYIAVISRFLNSLFFIIVIFSLIREFSIIGILIGKFASPVPSDQENYHKYN